MILHQQHLELAKRISTKIWTDPKKDLHPDFVAEKLARMEKVNTKIPENIWFFINQFSVGNILSFWKLARSLYYTPKKSPLNKKGKAMILGKELAEFIETEYFKVLEKETKLKII